MVDTAALRAEARVYEELGQNCYLSKSSALLLLDELDAARARIAELEAALGGVKAQLWHHHAFPNHSTSPDRCAVCDVYSIAEAAMRGKGGE